MQSIVAQKCVCHRETKWDQCCCAAVCLLFLFLFSLGAQLTARVCLLSEVILYAITSKLEFSHHREQTFSDLKTSNQATTPEVPPLRRLRQKGHVSLHT